MTNTKPTWEEEFEEIKDSLWTWEDWKSFIQKVERDAYERGYGKGWEDEVYSPNKKV